MGVGGGQQGGQQHESQQQLTKSVNMRILKRARLAICFMSNCSPRVIKKQTEDESPPSVSLVTHQCSHDPSSSKDLVELELGSMR